MMEAHGHPRRPHDQEHHRSVCLPGCAEPWSWFGEGKWTVNGNETCGKLKRTSVKDGKSSTGGDCWAWFQVGKKYMTFWSGEKDEKYSYYDSELRKMSAGDKVSKTVAELKKQSGI